MKFFVNKILVTSIAALSSFLTGLSVDVLAGEGSEQLKNKVVHEVESLLNSSANQAANTFGEGKTEISIRNIEHEESDWEIITTQPLTELGNDNSAAFWQGSLGSYDQSGDRRTTLNLGLGKRWLLDNNRSILGINSFVDYEHESEHSRASLGAEYRRTNFELHANNYWALSNTKSVGGTNEEALDGYDLIARGQMPFLPWMKIYAKGYRWNRNNQNDVKGDYYGLEMQLAPGLKLEVGQQDDNYMVESDYGKLTYTYPPKKTEVALFEKVIDDVAWRNGADMKEKMLDKVERTNKIVVEFGGITLSRSN